MTQGHHNVSKSSPSLTCLYSQKITMYEHSVCNCKLEEVWVWIKFMHFSVIAECWAFLAVAGAHNNWKEVPLDSVTNQNVPLWNAWKLASTAHCGASAGWNFNWTWGGWWWFLPFYLCCTTFSYLDSISNRNSQDPSPRGNWIPEQHPRRLLSPDQTIHCPGPRRYPAGLPIQWLRPPYSAPHLPPPSSSSWWRLPGDSSMWVVPGGSRSGQI